MDSLRRLSFFQSTDLIKEKYKKAHGGNLNTGKSLEISSAISQGLEYFQAASLVREVVYPLLQYYGVLSFSRAIILFLSRDLRESGLKQSHGLSASSWNEILEDKKRVSHL
jgi:hypothetical protein